MTIEEIAAPKNSMTRLAEAIHSLGIVHWMIFIICFINFVFFAKLITPLLSSLGSMLSAGEISPLGLVLLFLRPALLVAAGALLLFRKNLATYLFGLSALLMLALIPHDGMKLWTFTVLVLVCILGFCMRERSLGRLS